LWSTRVVILCSQKSYPISRIRILLGLKIQSELVHCNPFKPKFVHPFNLWPDSLPPNIQFLLLVISDSDRFGKSCPPLPIHTWMNESTTKKGMAEWMRWNVSQNLVIDAIHQHLLLTIHTKYYFFSFQNISHFEEKK
jgi:hypothetical protein